MSEVFKVFKCDASFIAKDKISNIAYIDLSSGKSKDKKIIAKDVVEAEVEAIKFAIKSSFMGEQILVCNDNQTAVLKTQKIYAKYKNIQIIWIPRQCNELADAITHNEIPNCEKINKKRGLMVKNGCWKCYNSSLKSSFKGCK